MTENKTLKSSKGRCLCQSLEVMGETMNVIDAALCLDCEEIYVRRNHNDGCPACGGRQSVPIKVFEIGKERAKTKGGKK